METCNSGGNFAKKADFYYRNFIFSTFTPSENKFLQKFWTINAHNNEEIIIKHWEKILRSLWKVFLVFFASVLPGTMVIWT